jgi:hypothetical protein
MAHCPAEALGYYCTYRGTAGQPIFVAGCPGTVLVPRVLVRRDLVLIGRWGFREVAAGDGRLLLAYGRSSWFWEHELCAAFDGLDCSRG